MFFQRKWFTFGGMKKIVLLPARPLMLSFLLAGGFLFFSQALFGQNYYDINFEGPLSLNGSHELYLDTISNPNNIWQIGSPQKTVFTSAWNIPNAIVTDTVNPYPVNDTSSFIISHIADMGLIGFGYDASIGGKYYVNSDTLTDFGTIEFSPDNGTTWIDLINDTIYGDTINWMAPNLLPFNEPVLTGNSNGWIYFRVDIKQLGQILNVQLYDSVMWRFSFISDGIQTNKDGLMFDSIFVIDIPPLNVADFNSENLTIVSPNPSSGIFTVTSEQEITAIEIYNVLGEKIFKSEMRDKKYEIDLSAQTKGIYFIKVITGDKVSTQKIIID